MLRELHINNFAIIDAVQLSFAPGMNVLTGETGAGKSIIMRAIGLLCGDRAGADLIRTDCEEATIEGVFDIDGDTRVLETAGLAPADEVLVRRVINRSGKGRTWVNGNLSTAAILSQIGTRLIHLYGQHEHALLLKPESHLDFLDQFGQLASERSAMATAYGAFRAASDRFAALTASGEAARQRLELLRFQVHELRDTKLSRGEEPALLREREVQRHAERLSGLCQQSDDALYSGEHAITGGLTRIAHQLLDASRIDGNLRSAAESLQRAAVEVAEVALELRRASARIQHDPGRLDQIEERLALLTRLKRKYGCEADELIDHHAALMTELGQLETVGIDLNAARQAALDHAAHAWEIARQLSATRQQVARELERRLRAELTPLGMRGATFRVAFTVAASDGPQPVSADPATASTAGLSGLGGDVVQFYFSANPGEPPKPLARIASGGELSRILLALKTLTAGSGDVGTLIFDEVDAGIGGVVAEAVGKRLRLIGCNRQVLCITHLPQIAAQADHHFVVEKRVVKGRTATSARALQPDDRVREITRMLGGTSTVESQQYARRLMADTARSAR